MKILSLGKLDKMLQITQNDNCLMPHKEKVEKLTRLCNQRKFDDVFKQTQILLKQFPMVYIFWNILGISASRLGNHYMAIEAFKLHTHT